MRPQSLAWGLMTINPDIKNAVTLVSGLARVKGNLTAHVDVIILRMINLVFANSEHVFKITL